MKRRQIIQGAGLAAVAAGLAACNNTQTNASTGASNSNFKPVTWKMVTSWPTNFPGLGTGAAQLAERITKASGGRLTVKAYGAGEIVPALEVFDAVSRGTAEMGHSAAYYWKGKAPAAPFFASVPFGLNVLEMNAWLYAEGNALWKELYAKFNLIPFACGNTGVQMAGWFRKPIQSVADFQGLKMRIPGVGGEVMAKLGAVPVNVPGGEIFTSLQSGAIDAAEWVGPYNDLAFGLHRVAKYCYFPGWQEPGPTLECMINKTAFEALPDDLQQIVQACCASINNDMMAEYTARNQQALETLQKEHGVQFLPLPADVLAALRQATKQVLDELAASDPFAKKVYESIKRFRAQARAFMQLSEKAYLNLDTNA
jgi:TRAP-type mannitol/chloroaromatic compound transport system substrate-binding protein